MLLFPPSNKKNKNKFMLSRQNKKPALPIEKQASPQINHNSRHGNCCVIRFLRKHIHASPAGFLTCRSTPFRPFSYTLTASFIYRPLKPRLSNCLVHQQRRSAASCTMAFCGRFPAYSDRIAQDSHLIPFYPAAIYRRPALETEIYIKFFIMTQCS